MHHLQVGAGATGRFSLLAGGLPGPDSLLIVGSLSRVLWMVLALLTLGGAVTFVEDLFRTTISNHTIPDQQRGRLAGVEQLDGSSGPALGDLRAGLLGARDDVHQDRRA